MKIFKSRIDVNVSSAFLLLSESVICFSIFPFFVCYIKFCHFKF